MELDTRIPLAIQPPDIAGAYGKGLQIKGLQSQQRMQDMQLRQAEDEAQAQRTLADLYRGNVGADGQINRAGVLQGAADRGLGARIPGLQKQFAEADKLGAEVKNTNSQIDERQFGVAKKKLEATGAGLQSLLANPNATPEDALNMIQGLVNAGIVTPEEGAKAWREVPTGSPQQFRSYLMQKGLQIVEANKRIELLTPKVQNINLGGSEQFVDTNTFTNPGVVGQQLTRTQTPDSVASNETARRGQNMTDAREREQPKGLLDPERGLLVNPRTGEASPITVGGKPVGSKKPTDGEQKVNDAKDVLSLLDDAEKLVDKATSSYAGAASDQALRAFGVSTGGAEAAAQLRALEGSLISKMPKMSGPQSDKDVLLYKQMAGQIGDPTIPAGTKKAAMKTIRDINERHAGIARSASPRLGATEDGYVFTGGDPADPKSWKKVK